MPLFQRSAIRDLYRRNRDVDIDKFPGIVSVHFQREYSSSDQISVLSLSNPPDSFEDGSLVAFNAMIQDTSFSPQLYLAKTSEGDCGGWGLDPVSGSDDIQYTDLRECKVFWAVSVPGLAAWSGSRECSSNYGAPLPHKYPIPRTPHIGVQLKVYDETLSKPLRVTDISCFIGILSLEPLHSNTDVSEPQNVPTLHVLFTKPLVNTIVPRTFPEQSIVSTIKQLRSELLQWIADEALGGDIIAAEWVLLTALARVQSRNPPIVPLTLTLSECPLPPEGVDSTPTLHHVLSLIFPLVTTLHLSLDVLNNSLSCPEFKDEDLHSGWLQLPRGSILILTESSVAEGSIFSRGVTTIRAVQDMMRRQSVEYIFPFSNYTFETDVNFIVLANGKQSTFFKTNVNIPLRLNTSIPEAGKNIYKSLADIKLPPADKLAQFRQLVGGAKVGNVNIGEAAGKHVEEDFVKERAATDSPGFTADDLVQRMLVSRMIALSFHEPEVTIDIWELAKGLERGAKPRQ